METVIVSESEVVTVVDPDALVEDVVVSEAVVKAMVDSEAEKEDPVISGSLVLSESVMEFVMGIETVIVSKISSDVEVVAVVDSESIV